MSQLAAYLGRYPQLRSRGGVWREIARYVQRDAPGVERVLEVGAGYCDFINAHPARERMAFDLNPQMAAHADPEVRFFVGDAIRLPGLAPRSVDLCFASNFLEHLELAEVSELLARVRQVLTLGGRLILLQPNHRLCEEHYFDDPTHKTAFDDLTIRLLLERSGFRVVRLVPGLLPFSMKSRLPKWSWLVRAYLNSPWKPLAAQMYIVAEVV
jgi:SAM-dependent methyltransferase